jgi:hypothetical protein
MVYAAPGSKSSRSVLIFSSLFLFPFSFPFFEELPMRQILSTAVMMFTLSLVAGGHAKAADKTYQVTGPVLEVTDTVITVEKGKEKWQLARDKDTKVTGDLKVGAKVTVEYRMTATSVEVKSGGKAAKAPAEAKVDKK